MKTAMQQLIEYLLTLNDAPNTRMKILAKADSLLEVEKRQITDAWVADESELQKIAAEKYYNDKFKD